MIKSKSSPIRSTQSSTDSQITELEVTDPQELMDFLRERISNKSRNFIKGVLSRGQVSVQQHVITQYNYLLRTGDIVRIAWKNTQDEDYLMGMHILYEDEDLIVIHKEAGLLSIATETEKKLTAYHQLSDYVKKKKATQRIFVVHRLDRDTSGVMLFAKNEKAKLTLQNHWKEYVKHRTYVAVVENEVIKQEDTLVSWLKESKSLHMYSSPLPNGGQEAITTYQVKQVNSHYSLLEIQLQTGRKNQIRVHMQDIGHPIIGDEKYGSKRNPIDRLALHAHTLEFIHPRTEQPMRFESPIPTNFLQLFVGSTR